MRYSKKDKTFQDFDHVGLEDVSHEWSLRAVPDLVKLTHVIEDEERHGLIVSVIDTFTKEVLANTDQLRQGIG